MFINKPAGLAVHPGSLKHSKSELFLTDWLVEHYPQMQEVGDNPDLRPGIVHRLDKGTSGAMVAVKTQEAFNFLKEKFRNREVQKEYMALVTGVLKETDFTVTMSIKRASTQGVKQRVVQKNETGGKSAETQFTMLEKNKEFSLVKAFPKTGRTHQIRVHLAYAGHPIVGDTLYGNWKDVPKLPELNRPFLHASALETVLPSGKQARLEAELPNALKNILKKLKTNQLSVKN